MRKLITISLLLLVMVAGCSFTTYAKEKTSGDFKYEVNDGLVTICKYTGSAKNVVIPEKIAGKEVYEIAKGAFQNCKNLVSIKIPRTLCFRVGAFKNCKKLVSVDYEGTKEDWESLHASNDPSGRSSAFLEKLLIEKEVKFKASTVNKSSVKLTWNKVSGISGYQIQIATDRNFKKVKKDIKIKKQSTTKATIKGIKTSNAYFVRIRAYKERKVNGSKVKNYTYWSETTNDNYYYKVLKNGTIELTKYVGNNTKNITIPSKIREKKVSKIGDHLFSNDKNLKSVTLPKSVTHLGYGVFEDCKNLSTVHLQCNLKTIENSLFAGCKNLKSLVIPSGVKKIKAYAFCRCKNLKSLVIPSGVEEIEQNVFSGCENLKTIHYKGTIKQWRKIKIPTWGTGVLEKVKVQCKDGVVKAIVK